MPAGEFFAQLASNSQKINLFQLKDPNEEKIP
jgi:hypothetical protein